MFKQVGIDDKTNHSLRATGATCLYSANVPEKIIQQRTGHQSLKSLRTYERTSDEQHLAVSTILTDPSNVVYGSDCNECRESNKCKSLTKLSYIFLGLWNYI